MAESKEQVTINISTSALLKIILVGLILVGLYIIRDIVLMLLVSMILASAMDPLVEWLFRKAKFPRALSVLSVYVLFIAVIAMAVYFIVPPMITQFQELGGRLQSLQSEIEEGRTILSRVLSQVGIPQSLSALGDSFSGLTSNFFKTTLGVFNSLIQFVAILAISFYLINSENGMRNFIKSIVPYKHKAYASALTSKIQSKIARWLLGQFLLSTFIFILTFIGLSFLGVKFALALALFAGLLEIVPYLGPIISAIPAIFIAFVQSPTLALFVLLLYILVQQIENYILVPKVMGRTVGANPLLILVAVLVGFKFAGIIGMLLAVPIVASISVFVKDLLKAREAV